MTEQRQEAGDDSANVQAGRDVVLHVGLTLEEARQVALDVYRANFLELSGVAEEIARARAEEITDAFLSSLEEQSPGNLGTAADPDMQRALFAAQREYACSGEKDLEQTLVDLLVDRAAQDDRALLTLTLNEAITAAPKLTTEQRRAIAVCFILRYSSWKGLLSVDAFYDVYLRPCLMPLTSNLPTNAIAYQHIEYVGAGAISMGQVLIADALTAQAPGFFTRGMAANEVFPDLQRFQDDRRVLIPCIRDDTRLQLNAPNEATATELAESIGHPELEGAMRSTFQFGRMPGSEVRDELVARIPEAAELADVWDSSPLKNLTLTSVGIAIGHGYWRRATGIDAPLSIWISQ